MNTLVILAHPNMAQSSLNKQVIDELNKQPEQFTIHNLYETYPDEQINIEAEQRLIEKHDSIILQFPIYWYSCPSLLKKWIDETFAFNWAYGPEGHALENKPFALLVTTGADATQYEAPGETIEDILLPFKMTFHYTNADYKGFYTIYGPTTTKEAVESAARFAGRI